MALNPIIVPVVNKLTKAQLDILANGGTISSGGNSYSANENTLYLTPDEDSLLNDYVLSVANWSNNTYTLSVLGKNSNNHALVSNSNSGTTNADVLANARAIAEANIYRIIDNGDTLTFVCENTPSTDLKIQVGVFD